MRFLIVDDSREFRQLLAAMVRTRWPAAQTEEWDPRGKHDLRAVLARARYDAVLLGRQPNEADGFDWLTEIRRHPHAPPEVLMTDRADEALARDGAQERASWVLRRSDLSAARLVHALEQALRAGKHAGAALAEPTPAGAGGSNAEAEPRTGPHGPEPRIAGYRILGLIGQGGMARVYLAERDADGMRLVLKLLNPALRADAAYAKRLEREYRLLSTIRNEYVARVYEQNFTGEHAYIAMEFLSGGSLASRMHEGLTSREALRITSQIARALDAVHAHGIVHRDLKPQNILFRDNGLPAIVDFGLAKSLVTDLSVTLHGQVLATPHYASPEQCLGQPVDHRSDLYSLGVIFYEMLSGHPIYRNEAHGAAEIVHLRVHGPTPRLPGRLAGYQPILDRLLAKNPADRFQSARELFAKIAI